jgi:hypothetical protein
MFGKYVNLRIDNTVAKGGHVETKQAQRAEFKARVAMEATRLYARGLLRSTFLTKHYRKRAHLLWSRIPNHNRRRDDKTDCTSTRRWRSSRLVSRKNGVWPRALGGRSILGDPRSESMQKTLNLKVKYRESFRPFAPSVLREDVANWFELNGDSPYMLLVVKVKENKCYPMSEKQEQLFGIDKLNIRRSEIPAVTHVDYSARIQTVHKETNHKYHALITKFKEKTGCSVVVNTSFNVRGEPIVSTPEDAFKCFMGTYMDVLVIGNCLLEKNNQEEELI